MNRFSLTLLLLFILTLIIRLYHVVAISAKNEEITFGLLILSHDKYCRYTHQNVRFTLEDCTQLELGRYYQVAGKVIAKSAFNMYSASSYEYLFDKHFFMKKELIVHSIHYSSSNTKTLFVWFSKILTQILSYKEYSVDLIDSALDQKISGLLQALVLGDDQNMSAEMSHLFLVTGILHLVVVSGQHLSLVISGLNGLITFFPKGAVRFAFIASLCWVLALITGGGASVVRAATTITFQSFAQQIWHRRVPTWWICLMVTSGLLIINPWFLISQSFWLSSLAYYAVISSKLFFSTQSDGKSSWFESFVRNEVVGSWHISLVVSLGLFPVLAFWFEKVSFLSPVVTALVGWIVAPVIWLTVLFILIDPVAPLLSGVIQHLISYLINFLLLVVSFFAQFEWLVIDFSLVSWLEILATWCALFVVIWLYSRTFIFMQKGMPR